MHENGVRNFAETHFIINMENECPFELFVGNNLKYADFLSREDEFKMVIGSRIGRDAKITELLGSFENRNSICTMRRVLDNVLGVAYRKGSKFPKKRMVLPQVLSEKCAIISGFKIVLPHIEG